MLLWCPEAPLWTLLPRPSRVRRSTHQRLSAAHQVEWNYPSTQTKKIPPQPPPFQKDLNQNIPDAPSLPYRGATILPRGLLQEPPNSFLLSLTHRTHWEPKASGANFQKSSVWQFVTTAFISKNSTWFFLKPISSLSLWPTSVLRFLWSAVFMVCIQSVVQIMASCHAIDYQLTQSASKEHWSCNRPHSETEV